MCRERQICQGTLIDPHYYYSDMGSMNRFLTYLCSFQFENFKFRNQISFWMLMVVLLCASLIWCVSVVVLQKRNHKNLLILVLSMLSLSLAEGKIQKFARSRVHDNNLNPFLAWASLDTFWIKRDWNKVSTAIHGTISVMSCRSWTNINNFLPYWVIIMTHPGSF